jgi:excisionase family DNA binding protein
VGFERGPKSAVGAIRRRRCNGDEGFKTPEQLVPVDIVAELRLRRTAWKVPELAVLLSVGPRTLYDLIERGSLPAIRFRTVIRINPIDALELVAGPTCDENRRAA